MLTLPAAPQTDHRQLTMRIASGMIAGVSVVRLRYVFTSSERLFTSSESAIDERHSPSSERFAQKKFGQYVIHSFDRPPLLPTPLDQPGRFPLSQTSQMRPGFCRPRPPKSRLSLALRHGSIGQLRSHQTGWPRSHLQNHGHYITGTGRRDYAIYLKNSGNQSGRGTSVQDFGIESPYLHRDGRMGTGNGSCPTICPFVPGGSVCQRQSRTAPHGTSVCWIGR